jgi:hypothetical protein
MDKKKTCKGVFDFMENAPVATVKTKSKVTKGDLIELLNDLDFATSANYNPDIYVYSEKAKKDLIKMGCPKDKIIILRGDL